MVTQGPPQVNGNLWATSHRGRHPANTRAPVPTQCAGGASIGPGGPGGPGGDPSDPSGGPNGGPSNGGPHQGGPNRQPPLNLGGGAGPNRGNRGARGGRGGGRGGGGPPNGGPPDPNLWRGPPPNLCPRCMRAPCVCKCDVCGMRNCLCQLMALLAPKSSSNSGKLDLKGLHRLKAYGDYPLWSSGLKKQLEGAKLDYMLTEECPPLPDESIRNPLLKKQMMD